jgi:peroxiredoxin Q/BCP
MATKAKKTATLELGDKAPDFDLPSDKGRVKLSAFKGKTVVLYFYPRDDTPGCTKEACGFNESLLDFSRLKAEIIGVSKDSEASHAKFRKKYGLDFHLASDAEGDVLAAYGSWIEKSMYGRKYMGIDRSTFLIDAKGVLRGIWRGVKVPGHVDDVLEAAKAL